MAEKYIMHIYQDWKTSNDKFLGYELHTPTSIIGMLQDSDFRDALGEIIAKAKNLIDMNPNFSVLTEPHKDRPNNDSYTYKPLSLAEENRVFEALGLKK